MTTNERVRVAWKSTGWTRYKFGEALGMPTQRDHRGQRICKTINNQLATPGTSNFRRASESAARHAESVAKGIKND